MPVPRTQQTPSGALRWLLCAALVLALVLVGLARLDRGIRRSPREMVPLEEVSPGWWETRQLIYHGIPARALLRPDAGGAGRARELARLVWAEFERIGEICNSFDPASEVGKLNEIGATGGGRVSISGDLHAMLSLSRQLWEHSDGAFDPTVWPLKQLWERAVRVQQAPSAGEVAAALEGLGLGRLALAPGVVVLPEGFLQLDLGGIAKGYAVDRVAALLQAEGVTDYLVQLGGEVVASGPHDGAPWRIGVQHPLQAEALWGRITHEGSLRVSTSGNYRQPLVIGKETYYHIFDPRTGWPASTRVLGVTTADLTGRASCALLDGAATAITVLGPEAGLELARALDLEALILTAGPDGDVIEEHLSEGLRPHYAREAP